MAGKSPPNPQANPKAKPAQTRDDRLKAALKANLGRRKAQARARSNDGADTTGKQEG